MKLRSSLLLLLSVLCASVANAHAGTGHLYPVKGPLAAQTPTPVFKASFSFGANLMAKGFKTALGNGEQFKGNGGLVSTKTGPGDSDGDIASAWDAVYGKGFYTAHVLGDKSLYRAAMTGSNGTALTVEFRGDGKGVALDSQGNVYKVVF
jgi:hypothetical protein